MPTRRLTIAMLTVLTVVLPFASSAQACCLTNWLCGRKAQPYVAGYAVYPAATYPVQAAYPAQAAYPVQVNYGAVPILPQAANGAYQVQRPAYYANPSVYTGMPVTVSQASATSVYRLPVPRSTLPYASRYPYSGARPAPTTLRGSTGVPLGTPGVVPSAYQSSVYRSGYSAYAPPAFSTTSPGLPLMTPVPAGTPMSAVPATPGPPLFASTPPPQPSGLSRFFGSHLGTNYRSSYYRAPITYYRPVAAVNPVTGALVTVQQACTSNVQQLQRTPYTGFLPAQAGPPQSSTGCPTAGCPTAGCPTPGCPAPGCPTAQPVYGNSVQPNFGTTFAPPSGVGQVGGITAPAGTGIAPIPTVAPQVNVPPTYAPNTAPLRGAPSAAGGDLAPMDAPQLQRPSIDRPAPPPTTPEPQKSPSQPSSTPQPSSKWKLQGAEDSTAMSSTPSAASQSAPASTGVMPIEAPDDYESPFGRGSVELRPTAPPSSQATETPPLPDPGARVIDASVRGTLTASKASLHIRQPGQHDSFDRPRRSDPRAAHSPPQPIRQSVSAESGWYTP